MSAKNYRFLVVPGHVISLDGDLHYINAMELIRLYGVNRDECLIDKYDGRGLGENHGLIVLLPSPKGDYSKFWQAAKAAQ